MSDESENVGMEDGHRGMTDNFRRGKFEGRVEAELDDIKTGIEKIIKNQDEMWRRINANEIAVSNQRTINGVLSGLIAIVVTFMSRWILPTK